MNIEQYYWIVQGKCNIGQSGGGRGCLVLCISLSPFFPIDNAVWFLDSKTVVSSLCGISRPNPEPHVTLLPTLYWICADR